MNLEFELKEEMPVETRSGIRGFLSFVDNSAGLINVCLMQDGQVFDVFRVTPKKARRMVVEAAHTEALKMDREVVMTNTNTMLINLVEKWIVTDDDSAYGQLAYDGSFYELDRDFRNALCLESYRVRGRVHAVLIKAFDAFNDVWSPTDMTSREVWKARHSGFGGETQKILSLNLKGAIIEALLAISIHK